MWWCGELVRRADQHRIHELSFQLGLRSPGRLRRNPMFDPIREEPQFQAVLTAMEADVAVMRDRLHAVLGAPHADGA